MTLIHSIRNIINGSVQDKEIIVPIDKRSVTVENSNGLNVSTDAWDLLIPLRNNLTLANAGATIITGADSNIQIPKYNGSNASFAGEVKATNASENSFEYIVLKPYRLTTTLNISNQFLLQESNNANIALQNDIINAIAEKLEQTFFGNEEGTDKPQGIFYNIDQETPLSYQSMIEIESELDENNVIGSNCSYIVNTKTKSLLRTTPKEAKSGKFIMQKDKIDGKSVQTTDSVIENGLVYGDFKEVVIAQFGNINISVDIYSLALYEMTKLTINAYFDIAVRRPECIKAIIMGQAQAQPKQTITLDMLNQWGVSTYKQADIDGYKVYQSKSNFNVGSGRAKVRITFKDLTEFNFKYRSDGETTFDYVIVSKLDTELGNSDSYTSAKVQYNTRGLQEQWFDASFECDENEHFIEVVYLKDGSGDKLQDSGFIAIPNDYEIIVLNAVLPPEPIIMKGKFTDDSTSSDWWYCANGSSSNKVNITEFVNPETKEFEVQIGETSKLKTLAYLFFNNKKIERIDELPVDENITNIYYLFNGCSLLTEIKGLENWNVGNVTNIGSMIRNCSALTEITGLENWNVGNVTDMSYMFQGSGVQNIDLSKWNIENVTSISWLFRSASSLKSVNLSGWNLSKVTSLSNLFYDCNSLQSLDLSNWNVGNVTNMSSMFEYCSALQTIIGPIYNIKADLDMTSCRNLSKETAEMLIKGLAEVETTKTLRFSTSADITVGLTLISEATAKGWTITGVYVEAEREEPEIG